MEVILFDGLPRTGKTTIAAMLVQKLKRSGYNAVLYSMRDKMPEYAREHIAYFYAGCIEAFYGFLDNMPDNAIVICDRSPFTELVYGPLRTSTIGKEAMIVPEPIIIDRLRAYKPLLLLMDNTHIAYTTRGAEQKDGFTYSSEAFESLREAFHTQALNFDNVGVIPPTASLDEALRLCDSYIAPKVQPAVDLAKFMEVQAAFNRRIYDVTKLSKRTKLQKVHEYILAMTDEVFELLRATKYKLHQPGPDFIDRDNAAEEAIDVFKYLLCIAELLGMSANEFARRFYYKSDIVDQKYSNFLKAKNLNDASNR